MSYLFIGLFVTLTSCYIVFVSYGGVLHYNTYYATLIRSYQAGYLKKLMPKYLYILGGWFLTPKIIENIAKNIPGNKNIQNDIKGYKKRIKIRNFALLILLIGFLPTFFVHFEGSRYLLRYFTFDWRIHDLAEKLFTFIDDSSNYLPMISLCIALIIAWITGIKLYKLEKKILNFINDSCDEKLKARDILASHQIN